MYDFWDFVAYDELNLGEKYGKKISENVGKYFGLHFMGMDWMWYNFHQLSNVVHIFLLQTTWVLSQKFDTKDEQAHTNKYLIV